MTAFGQAIRAQPDTLRASAPAAAAALASTDLQPFRAGALVVSAIGASHHAAIGLVHALRAAGRRATLVSPAELAAARPDRVRALGDAFVLVSQSGRSAETVAAARMLDGVPTLAVTATTDTPLAELTGATLPLGEFTDTPVATLSYTATLQALGMLAAALGADPAATDWGALADDAAELIDSCAAAVDALAERFAGVATLDAAGAGPSEGSARETALLAREGLRIPATGMETREYLHGPMESVAPGLGAVVFGDAREAELAATLRELGATVAHVGTSATGGTGAPGATGPDVEIPDAGPLARPLLEIVPVQLLAARVAAIRELPIGELRRSQSDTKIAAAA